MTPGRTSVPDGTLLGFPRRTHHVLLPSRPVRAALSLYDATPVHQRIAAVVGDVILAARLGSVLRVDTPHGVVDFDWWSRWCEEIGRGIVGETPSLAFRVWEDRVAALALDCADRPLAFAKVWHLPRHLSTWHPEVDLEAHVTSLLTRHRPVTFRTPAIIVEGCFDGLRYVAFAPLPPGRRRPMPARPALVRRIVDELQSCSARFIVRTRFLSITS